MVFSLYVGDVMFRRIMIIFTSRADEVEMIKPIFIFHITIVHTIDRTDCGADRLEQGEHYKAKYRFM